MFSNIKQYFKEHVHKILLLLMNVIYFYIFRWGLQNPGICITSGKLKGLQIHLQDSTGKPKRVAAEKIGKS